MGMRGLHRMNGETVQVNTQQERNKDRFRSLGLLALVAFLTVSLTGVGMLVP